MNTTLASVDPMLREVLYDISMASRRPSVTVINDAIRRYPQFTTDIVNFAVEITLDEFRLAANDESALNPSHVSPAVSRAMHRFRQAASRRPYKKLPKPRPLPAPSS